MKPTYHFGRFLELIGLLLLPCSIWAAEIRHSEREALTFFFVSIAVFFVGWLFTKVR